MTIYAAGAGMDVQTTAYCGVRQGSRFKVQGHIQPDASPREHLDESIDRSGDRYAVGPSSISSSRSFIP